MKYGRIQAYLRGSVARATTGCFQSATRLIHVTKAKIYHFQGSVIVYQQILRLQVSVADTETVDIVDGRDQFLEIFTGDFFF